MDAKERIAQIRERQARDKRLRERSSGIVAELRGTAACDTPAVLLTDAAEVIEWLQQTVAQMRKDAETEAKYAQRDARDSYDQGHLDGQREGRSDR